MTYKTREMSKKICLKILKGRSRLERRCLKRKDVRILLNEVL